MVALIVVFALIPQMDALARRLPSSIDRLP